MIQLHKLDQGSEEWLQLRADHYTGSGADKLLSHADKIKIVDGVASAYSLAEITGFGGNFWTNRGHILEEEAVELYEAITGTEVDRSVGFITNDRFPTCGYSPDGLPPVPLLEIKSFDKPHHMQLINAKRESDIPLKIRAQVHFGLLISGRKLAHLVPYNPNLDPEVAFKIIPIRANRNIQRNFIRLLAPRKVMV